MTSIRHNPEDPDGPFLAAARENILAVGWRRTTLTDVAKRAGVSRMTMYRRWPDMQTLLADLLVREWGGLIDQALTQGRPAADLRATAEGVVATVSALRDNELFRRIVEVDPELLLPYLLERRGRNQEHVLAMLTAVVESGQQAGVVRRGDAGALARTLLLALQGFVISSGTMSDMPAEDLDAELTLLIERYLRP